MYTRDDISLEDRLEIFSQFWRFQDGHGFISELAREWQVSRHFIYDLAERVRRAVDWRLAGRPATDSAEQKLEKLQNRVQALEAECEELRGHLAIERQETTRRRFGLLMELAMCPVSEDKITRCLRAAFGTTPSSGWINEQLQRAGQAALAIMERKEVRSALRVAALDEIFRHNQPILTLVEPYSLMAVVPQAAENRQGTTWKKVLDSYPNLELTVSDQGSGLLKGVKELGVIHQIDLFHFKRDLRREHRRLESRCYEAIEKVDRARKLITSPRLLSSAQVQAAVEYAEKNAKLTAQLEAFDWLTVIIEYLEEHLLVFNWRKKSLRNYRQAQAAIDEVLDLLEQIAALDVTPIKSIIAGAREGLFTFLTVLEQNLNKIDVQWRYVEGSRQAVFDQIGAVWYWQKQAGASEKGLKRYLAALIGLTYWRQRVENFSAVQKQVFDALDRVLRASSAVECINSIIRPYVSVKKHLSQGYLALIALYWDMHPLSQRAGRTPFEECGVHLGTNDWVELIELEMQRLITTQSKSAELCYA